VMFKSVILESEFYFEFVTFLGFLELGYHRLPHTFYIL
jgi:hypothetical protein